MLRIAILFGLSASVIGAHDIITTKITWSKEMSRLVYKRCAMCHREGGPAFSLVTYQVARPWAKAIKEEVLERRMPPFAAIKGFGPVKDQDALTQEELHLISDWVEGGSPEGDDPNLLPKRPDFSRPGGASSGAAASSTGSKGLPLIDDGTITLKQQVTLIGARAGKLAEGASIQAVVQQPNGAIQPLIWIYDYKPKFERIYLFEKPITLPAGSKIDLYPRGNGSLELLAQ